MSTWFDGPNVLGDALAQRHKFRWTESGECDIRHIWCGWSGGHDAAAMSWTCCPVVAKTSKTGAISCGARISQPPWHITLNWSENNQMEWWPIVFQWLFFDTYSMQILEMSPPSIHKHTFCQCEYIMVIDDAASHIFGLYLCLLQKFRVAFSPLPPLPNKIQ